MTAHAYLRARETGEGRILDRGMAITAIDSIIPDMMFVAEGNWLRQGNANVRHVGRPENRVGRPAGAAEKSYNCKNDDPKLNVGVARKDLGHAGNLPNWLREIAWRQCGWWAPLLFHRTRRAGRMLE